MEYTIQCKIRKTLWYYFVATINMLGVSKQDCISRFGRKTVIKVWLNGFLIEYTLNALKL